MNPEPSHDNALFTGLQAGDDAAMDRIMARWEQPLFAFAWRYLHNQADSQDLVAETFVRLYQQRDRLLPDTRLSAWLFTTLSNLCHNHYRWRRRHPTVSLDAPQDENSDAPSGFERHASEAPTAAVQLERDEALAALTAALGRLPHELKTTLLLHYFEQLSYRQIGEITGCSERGVETRLYRARQRLREELASQLRAEAAAAGETSAPILLAALGS